MSKKQSDSKRFKSYFGNKQEGQGFADKRKRKAAYEYLKLLKKEKQKGGDAGGANQAKHRPIHIFQSPNRNPGKGRKRHAFTVAEKVARQKQEKRERQREEEKRKRAEKDTALKTYKDQKKQQHLKLCKRTSKGQPVMKYQMEVLLEKIHKQKSQTQTS